MSCTHVSSQQANDVHLVVQGCSETQKKQGEIKKGRKDERSKGKNFCFVRTIFSLALPRKGRLFCHPAVFVCQVVRLSILFPILKISIVGPPAPAPCPLHIIGNCKANRAHWCAARRMRVRMSQTKARANFVQNVSDWLHACGRKPIARPCSHKSNAPPNG